MAVRVFSNNLPNPTIRLAVEEAVLQTVGSPAGDWRVQIHEKQDSPSWFITIWGPNNFQWNHEFFGIEEQNSLNGYAFIRKSISDALRPVVYLSCAYPDSSDDFVKQFSDRLGRELQIQGGEPTEVIWDRTRDDAAPADSNERLRLGERATFLVPLLSPSYFKNDLCRKEFEAFEERRQIPIPLVLPVYFITSGELEGEAKPQEIWVRAIKNFEIFDFRPDRFDLTTTRARRLIESLARSIRQAHAKLLQHDTPDRPTPKARIGPSAFVQSLRLENFRCFDAFELRFDRASSLEGRWTCIAGVNGAGKSTILQALGIALLGNPLALELGGERLNRMRRQTNFSDQKRATVEVDLRELDSKEMFRFKLAIDEGRIVAESGPTSGTTLAWDRVRQLVIAGYGATRNLSPRVDASSDHLSVDVRHQITLFEPLSQLSGAEELSGRNSASWPFLDLFQNLVKQVFDTELQIALSSPPAGIRFKVANDDNIEAVDLPDGFRSATAWMADLCSLWCEKAPNLASNGNPKDIQAIVLIDEIDLHLHPSLQRSLVPRLRKALPNVQWIVTTHSPLVLANFDVNEIIALDSNSDGHMRTLDRQILGFSADEIYEWLMGTRPVGATIEEELKKNESSLSRENLATMMRISPQVDEEAARSQVAEFKDILKTLNR